MSRKDFVKAAQIVRQEYLNHGDIFSKLMEEQFIELFRNEPKFNEFKFKQACRGEIIK